MKTKEPTPITVTEENVGQRLDRYLSTLSEITSRSYAQDLIDKGRILLDGKPVKASASLKLNQVITIDLPELATTELMPYDFPLNIVHEDSDLIVINKPSGLVVHPAAGHEQDTLVNALLHHTKDLSMKNEMRPGIVHRIDKETSGLLVVAKNDAAHENLSLQFKNKTTHRLYFALVDGNFQRSKGTLTSYLARHPSDRKRYASLKENNRIITEEREDNNVGKWSITRYEKMASASSMSYMKVQLETGRTHQIRVHMSEMRHPLVGDTTYGYSALKMKNLAIKRFFLHASELGFTHPTTNEFLQFKVPWPADDEKKLLEFGFSSGLLKK